MKFARSINSAQYCSQKNSQKLRLEKIKNKNKKEKWNAGNVNADSNPNTYCVYNVCIKKVWNNYIPLNFSKNFE